MPIPASPRRHRLFAYERHHSPVYLKDADLNGSFLTFCRDIKLQNILLTGKGVLKLGAVIGQVNDLEADDYQRS